MKQSKTAQKKCELCELCELEGSNSLNSHDFAWQKRTQKLYFFASKRSIYRPVRGFAHTLAALMSLYIHYI
jgi:hypothetical protein